MTETICAVPGLRGNWGQFDFKLGGEGTVVTIKGTTDHLTNQ